MDESGLKIVVVNGRPGSGKTTFEYIIKKKMSAFCEMRSTVDLVKEIAIFYAGWDGNKDLKNRKFLSDLKDLLTKFDNVPFNDIVRYKDIWESDMKRYGVINHPHVLLVDSREPEEIQKFKDELGAVAVLIRRTEVENEETSNHAVANVFDFDYDWVIENNGSLEDLELRTLDFLDLLFDGNWSIMDIETEKEDD